MIEYQTFQQYLDVNVHPDRLVFGIDTESQWTRFVIPRDKVAVIDRHAKARGMVTDLFGGQSSASTIHSAIEGGGKGSIGNEFAVAVIEAARRALHERNFEWDGVLGMHFELKLANGNIEVGATFAIRE